MSEETQHKNLLFWLFSRLCLYGVATVISFFVSVVIISIMGNIHFRFFAIELALPLIDIGDEPGPIGLAFICLGYFILIFPLAFLSSVKVMRHLIGKYYIKAFRHFLRFPIIVGISAISSCLVFLSPLLSCSILHVLDTLMFPENPFHPSYCDGSNPPLSMIYFGGAEAVFVFMFVEIVLCVFFNLKDRGFFSCLYSD